LNVLRSLIEACALSAIALHLAVSLEAFRIVVEGNVRIARNDSLKLLGDVDALFAPSVGLVGLFVHDLTPTSQFIRCTVKTCPF
jgi:hypothetical protein